MPSSWLVALQFALIGTLLLSSRPPGEHAFLSLAIALLLAATAIGIAALMTQRLGNFSTRSEVKPGARMVTAGIYRQIRHPMHSAAMLAMLAAVLADPRGWRVAMWLGLLTALIAKALREERHLLQRFAAYDTYRSRTWRLMPWLW